MPLDPGTRLGPYEIGPPIGAGGMGEVHRARDTKLDRDVAIKVLPEEFAADEERLARFEREAKLLASLNHPNIAGIYGFEESDGVKALALELVEGPTLAERIEQGPIPVDETIAIAKQIAEALEAGHESGVIHRDLKPANIKLREDGAVKVLDYGLAKALEGDAASGPDSELSQSPTLTRQGTQVGAILGTAAYMSPEQAKGERVDTATDTWAFGAVLYEMLTGTNAFQGEGASETIAAVLRSEPAFDSIPSRAPRSVHELVRLCLVKDKRQRFSSIRDARLVLEGAFARETVSSGRSPAASGMGLLFVTAAISAIATWFVASSRDAETTLPVRRFSLPMDTRNNILDAPAISPDGTMVAFADHGRLWVRRMNDIDAKPVLESIGASHPFWSPDSRQLAFMVEKTLKVTRIDEGRTVELAALPANFFVGGSWSSSGTIVLGLAEPGAGGGLVGQLYSVSENGGSVEPYATPDEAHEVGFASPHFLPDGETLLYVVARPGGAFELVVKRGASETNVAIEQWKTWSPFFPPSVVYAPSGHLIYSADTSVMAQTFSPSTGTLTEQPVLVASDARTPSVSRDGTLVYKSSRQHSGTQRLVWLDRSGVVASVSGASHDGSIKDVALSPDGGRIAYSDASTVFVYDIARDATQRLTFSNAVDNYATWSPDGNELLFSSTRNGDWDFYVKAADGSSGVRALETSDASDWNPRWSYDGRYIVYHAIGPETQGRDIQYLDLGVDGPAPQSFLATEHHEGDPVLSPDNRFIAYQSDESGRLEVYVKPFPEGDGKWQLSVGGGFQPLWSRSGSELFFVQENRLLVVDVSTRSGFTSGTPRLVADSDDANLQLGINPWAMFNPLNYDVTADGERILVVQNVGGSTEAFTVVENWAEELKRLVPTGK